MSIPHAFVVPLSRLVEDIVSGNFHAIQDDGRAGRLDAFQIKYAIEKYGDGLVLPPQEAYLQADGVQVDGLDDETWLVDFELWTKREGESELTLSVKIIRPSSDDEIKIYINDLHLL